MDLEVVLARPALEVDFILLLKFERIPQHLIAPAPPEHRRWSTIIGVD